MNGGKDPSISLCRLRTGGSKAVQTDTETGPLKKPKKTLVSTLLLMVVAFSSLCPRLSGGPQPLQDSTVLLGSAGPKAREDNLPPKLTTGSDPPLPPPHPIAHQVM